VVLSGSGWGGGDLVGSLNSVGIVTGNAEVGGYPEGLRAPWFAQNSQITQLQTDVQTLNTELQSLAAKSGVTVADLSSLQTDTQSIVGAGAWLNPQNLQKSISELATAVAGGSDTTQAKTDFNALFTGTNVAQTTIDKTFNDLIETIQDSRVTTTDLSTVATDQGAIQTDLNNLMSGHGAHGEGLFGLGGGQSLGSGLASGLAAASVAITTLPGGGSVGQGLPWGTQNTQLTKLHDDLQKLQSDLQGLATKSGVTVGDLATLQSDSQTIAGAGLRLNPQNQQKAVNKLVSAVANGADTSQAKSDFNALFKGSNVGQDTIDKTFNDLVKTIQDSKVTGTNLTSIAGDKAAIQTDWSNLHNGAGSSGSGSTGGSTGGTTGSTSGSGTGSGTTHRGGFRRFRGFRRFHR
jgi:hypothetical protein